MGPGKDKPFGLRPSNLRCIGVSARSEKSGSLRKSRYPDSSMFHKKRMRKALTKEAVFFQLIRPMVKGD